MNSFQNKLQGSELKTPSTKAFQHQQQFRMKNYQSDVMKQSLSQPTSAAEGFTKSFQPSTKQPPQQLFASSKSDLQIPSINNQVQQKQQKTYFNLQNSGKQIIENTNNANHQFNISSRSSMYDFRQNTGSQRQLFAKESSYQNKGADYYRTNKPLTPIKETATANIVPPSRSVSGPDNGITFLDNGNRIINPINVKTPPPPMGGEILEEENYDPNESFYDHERAEQELKRRKQMEDKRARASSKKKLIKKIVYVYESESDDEDTQKKEETKNQFTSSVIQQNKPENLNIISSNRRGLSNDARYGQQQQFNKPQLYQNQTNLPAIISQASLVKKPPLPNSQPKHQQLNNGSRQIRTGAFQRLSSVGLQILK